MHNSLVFTRPGGGYHLLELGGSIGQTVQKDHCIAQLILIGLTCWIVIYLFQVLPSSTFEGEWQLFQCFLDNGVFFHPGSFFSCPEPGWFRLVFAVSNEVLQLGEKTWFDILDSNEVKIRGSVSLKLN